ncbi:hypothetical protein NT6N_38160 [Oceaniferula spumae]|uniref:PEP-CTERM protein-sorting domain-containing protein n=1 Tax=Oceaniferula spumae TaxID=2979115 RepID=A0AAT9FSB5_9BACT
MKTTFIVSSMLAGAALCVNAATFYTISSVGSSNSVAFYQLSELIEGPGVGYDASAPHDQAAVGANGRAWVTNNPNGNGDYYAVAPAPVIVFDLGSDVLLTEISTWGYDTGNTNGAKDFSLRFATAAEGTGAFGTSITFNPTFEADFATTPRDSNVFGQSVTAQYVEMTITDNWRGFQGGTPGGDRVGLGEVAFAQVPEPSSALLAFSAASLMLLRRKRNA